MLFFGITVGLPVVLALWLFLFQRWQRGIWLLLLYLPFAGSVALMLRPNPAGALLKDFLFVLPTYAIFFLLHTRELRKAPIPQPLTLMLLVLGALVLLQVFNPGLSNLAVGAVGVKVWLLYIPLAYLTAVMIEDADDLVRLLRMNVAVALIPCGVGLLQFLMCTAIGYETAMTLFYGSLAYDVTQRFTSFYMGAQFFRIPSTFSFVTQYAGYTLMMIVIVYMHQSVETHPRWRAFSRVMMIVIFAAALLCGARGNFVFTPLLFLMILFLDAKLSRLAGGLAFGPLIMIAILEIAGFDPLRVFTASSGLLQQYSGGLVLPELIAAIAENPLGTGTGMNTGPAVNVMSAVEEARAKRVEGGGYYAKAAIELGFAGFILVSLIFGALILYALRIRRILRDPRAQSCAAAIMAFFIHVTVTSFKGWQIDLDPFNVWFWVFVGILFRLPYLRFEGAAAPQAHGQRRRLHRRPLIPRPGAVTPGPPSAG